MRIRFDSFGKKNIGQLFKAGEYDPMGKRATVNIDLSSINYMEVRYLVNNRKYKDVVKIDNDEIIIPFSKDVIKEGVHEFEIIAYTVDGGIKTSQTYIYGVGPVIGNSNIVTIPSHNINTLPSNVDKKQIIDDIRTYPVTVDMDKLDTLVTDIKFKQYDFGSSQIIMQLFDDEIPLQLDNVHVVVSFLNSKDDIIIDTLTSSDGVRILTSIDGVIKITIPDVVLRVGGKVDCEVMIIDNDSKRSTAPRISFNIVNSLINHEDITDITYDDRYSILTTLMNDINVLHGKTAEAATIVDGLVNTTNELVSTANNLIVEAEKVKNETIIVKNDTNAVKVATELVKDATEKVKTDTEAVRVATEKVRVNTEAIKNETEKVKNDTNAVKVATEAVRVATENVKNDTNAVKVSTEQVRVNTEQVRVSAENKIINVETRMQYIEDNFDNMVDGTGFAGVEYVDSELLKTNQELERVKKLEEATTSTVVTESSFATVEQTSNGYFEDVELKGKTLINVRGGIIELTDGCEYSKSTGNYKITSSADLYPYISFVDNGLKYGGTYTILINIIKNTIVGTEIPIKVVYGSEVEHTIGYIDINNNVTGLVKIVIRNILVDTKYIKVCVRPDTSGDLEFNDFMILEGDHTQNPPAYFEGLKSVGDGTDEIVVSSVNSEFYHEVDLISGKYNNDTGSFEHSVTSSATKTLLNVIPSATINISNPFKPDIAFRIYEYDSNKCLIKHSLMSGINRDIILSNYTMYIAGQFGTPSFTPNIKCKITVNNGCEPQKSDKKQLLFLDDADNTWKKPILDEFSTVKKGSDGKYRYYKRGLNRVYKEGDETNVNCITDMTTTVEKVEEKVYECTSLDLICYEGETNYSIESGVISPRTTLKVHQNISNIVRILQNKVSGLDNNKVIKIENELKESENAKYKTINGEKEFTCKSGYVDNIHIEGETFVNLARRGNVLKNSNGNMVNTYNVGDRISDGKFSIINLSDKVVLIESVDLGDGVFSGYKSYESHANSITIVDIPKDKKIYSTLYPTSTGWDTSVHPNDFNTSNILILEGDWTNKKVPSTYFEGIKSVGQGDKIDILNYSGTNIYTDDNKNIDKIYDTLGNLIVDIRYDSSNFIEIQPDTTYFSNIPHGFGLYDSTKTMIFNSWTTRGLNAYIEGLITPSNARYLKCNLEKDTNGYYIIDGRHDKHQISTTLHSLPNGVKDEIVKHGDKYFNVQRCGEVVLTGGVVGFGNPLNGTNMVNVDLTCNGDDVSVRVFCDKLKSTNIVSMLSVSDEGLSCNGQNKLFFRLSSSKCTDLATANAYFLNNPHTVVYELANPIITEIPNPNIRTYEGENTLLLNSGVIQGDVRFEVTNSLGSALDVMASQLSSYRREISDLTNKVNNGNSSTLPEGFNVENSGEVMQSNITEGAPVVWQNYGDLENKIDELINSPINFPNNGIYTVEFDYVGKYLAIGCSKAPYLNIYKYENDIFTKMPNPNISSSYSVEKLKFSHQGNYLFIKNQYDNVLYKIEDDDTFIKCTGVYNNSDPVGDVTFSYDDKILLIVGYNTNFRHWYSLAGTIATQKHRSTSAAYNRTCMITNDNRFLFISGDSHSTYCYDLINNTEVSNPFIGYYYYGIASSNQHNLIAVGATNVSSDKIVIYEYSNGTFTKKYVAATPNGFTYYNDIRFSADGNYLMCLSKNNEQYVVHCYKRNGYEFNLIDIFNIPPSQPYVITLSGDGLYLAIKIRLDNLNIYIYRIKQKQLVYPYEKQSLPFIKMAQRSVGVALESKNVGEQVKVNTFPKFNIL